MVTLRLILTGLRMGNVNAYAIVGAILFLMYCIIDLASYAKVFQRF